MSDQAHIHSLLLYVLVNMLYLPFAHWLIHHSHCTVCLILPGHFRPFVHHWDRLHSFAFYYYLDSTFLNNPFTILSCVSSTHAAELSVIFHLLLHLYLRHWKEKGIFARSKCFCKIELFWQVVLGLTFCAKWRLHEGVAVASLFRIAMLAEFGVVLNLICRIMI